jgi:ribosome biogenesis SPOUT family RNA methylase Rps3
MTTPSRPSYIIEHMEDLDADPTSPTTFPQWALLEYRQMLKDVGPGSTVHFTGLISESSKEALRQALSTSSSSTSANADFKVHSEGILDMAKKSDIDITSICLLDPKSPFPLSIQDAALHPSTEMTSSDAGGPFSHFLFGGILGDDPPRDRTGHLRSMRFPSRHLGGLQMTTDSALNVVKLVVEDGIAMGLPGTENEGPGGTIDWIDNPELHLGQGESVSATSMYRAVGQFTDICSLLQVIMPFRYVAEKMPSGGKRPHMPDGMREHIKKDLDRAFEF